jgi:ABC-type uncharacterized transport system permease subunit
MKKYYFLERKGEKKGPFSLEDLRNETIYEDDLIWNNEIEEWTQSKNLDEVSDLIIIRPPKTPDEIIEEKIKSDNILIRRIVIKRTSIIYLILSIILTMIAYLATDNFIDNGLYGKKGVKMYYSSKSIFTRAIEAFQGEFTVEGGEYENRNLLFFKMFISSILFFSFVIPIGFFYYLINRSTKKHYKNYS